MKSKAAWISACLALAGGSQTLLAQLTQEIPKLRFEVASVKPVQKADLPPAQVLPMIAESHDGKPIPIPSPGRMRMKQWSLRAVVAAAHGVRRYRVYGPSWMDEEYFDIEATLPAGATRDQAREMLQGLLAERFGLELHREQREIAGFALIVGKNGPKLQLATPAAPQPEADTPEEAQRKQREQSRERMAALQAQTMRRLEGARASGAGPGQASSWNAEDVTTTQLAEALYSRVGGPVVDETGLTGKYNMMIETWSDTENSPGQTIFDAVARLGLKLTPRKLKLDVLVVDKVSKVPTAN